MSNDSEKNELTEGLTQLGSGEVARPSRTLEAFPNQHPERRYTVTLESSEFTCVCPMTGQPDFATIKIRYIPDKRIVESKSLKLYLWSFRDEGHFHEHVTDSVVEGVVEVLVRECCEGVGEFNVGGGIFIAVEGKHEKG